MHEHRDKNLHLLITEALQREIEQLVQESLQGSLNLISRGLHLVKKLLFQNDDKYDTSLAYLNKELPAILSRYNQEMVKEILETFEKSGIITSTNYSEKIKTKDDGYQKRPGIHLIARHGEQATSSFVIINSGKEEHEVTFRTTEFINENGHIVSSPKVLFIPRMLKSKPGQELTVKFNVSVDDLFEIDKIYTAQIQFPNLPNKEIPLKLEVLDSLDAIDTQSKNRCGKVNH